MRFCSVKLSDFPLPFSCLFQKNLKENLSKNYIIKLTDEHV